MLLFIILLYDLSSGTNMLLCQKLLKISFLRNKLINFLMDTVTRNSIHTFKVPSVGFWKLSQEYEVRIKKTWGRFMPRFKTTIYMKYGYQSFQTFPPLYAGLTMITPLNELQVNCYMIKEVIRGIFSHSLNCDFH